MAAPIRIANSSGFLGDRFSAPVEMVEGGPIDILTGDYLAELTMAILARQRRSGQTSGYARSFAAQLPDILVPCMERGIRIVTNAGGLDPVGLADRLRTIGRELGLAPSVAAVAGDDLMETSHALPHGVTGESFAERGVTPIAANAYLGGWGIVEALSRGADIVVTGRVADASLVVGAAAWHHGWQRDDWDPLAGAVVAGHVIECGAQATGGNYSFFEEVPDISAPGFPIAEVHEDGSSVITKHPGSGGLVSPGTVTAQLVYEIGGPRYLNPDVVARLDTVVLESVGPDRVSIEGVRGLPPPPTTKVSAAVLEGHQNTVTFLIAGLDVAAKADVALAGLWQRLGGSEQFDGVETRLIRTDHSDPGSHEAAFARLQVTVWDRSAELVGRAFSNAAVELALASYPGFTLSAPPADSRVRVVYWPSTTPQRDSIVHIDEQTVVVPPTAGVELEPAQPEPEEAATPGRSTDGGVVQVPIGRLVGTRSGDKGGDANLGVWCASDPCFAWLRGHLTTERLRNLIPEARTLAIRRYVFPNLRAINFVLEGYLGEGVSSSVAMDPQAKALGEYLRAKVVTVPEELVAV